MDLVLFASRRDAERIVNCKNMASNFGMPCELKRPGPRLRTPQSIQMEALHDILSPQGRGDRHWWHHFLLGSVQSGLHRLSGVRQEAAGCRDPGPIGGDA